MKSKFDSYQWKNVSELIKLDLGSTHENLETNKLLALISLMNDWLNSELMAYGLITGGMDYEHEKRTFVITLKNKIMDDISVGKVPTLIDLYLDVKEIDLSRTLLTRVSDLRAVAGFFRFCPRQSRVEQMLEILDAVAPKNGGSCEDGEGKDGSQEGLELPSLN